MFIAPKPTWVNSNINNFLSDAENREILGFYLFNSPYVNSTAQSIPLSKHGWKGKSSEFGCNNPFIAEYINAHFPGGFHIPPKDNFESVICTSSLEPFPPESLENEIAILMKANSLCESFFAHLRNAFAHGRFILENNKAGQQVFIFEDVNPNLSEKGTGRITLTGRFVVTKKTLLDIEKYIVHMSYVETDAFKLCLDSIRSGYDTKSKLISLTRWNDEIYNHVTKCLRKEGIISYPKEGITPKDQKWVIN